MTHAAPTLPSSQTDTSRRSFLSRMGIGVAVVATASVPVVVAAKANNADPVFAAIDRHKASMETHRIMGDEMDAAYDRIPKRLQSRTKVQLEDGWGLTSSSWDVTRYFNERLRIAKMLPKRRRLTAVRDLERERDYLLGILRADDQELCAAEKAVGFDIALKRHAESGREIEASYNALFDVKIETLAGLTAWATYLDDLQRKDNYHERRMSPIVAERLMKLGNVSTDHWVEGRGRAAS